MDLRNVVIVAVGLALGVGCGKPEAPKPAAPKPAAGAPKALPAVEKAPALEDKAPVAVDKAPSDPKEAFQKVCLAAIDKKLACTDDYIPALVDLRVGLDFPSGIAAKASTPEGKAALVAEAKEEWKTDSVDPKRTETCAKHTGGMPPERLAKLTEAGTACLAKTDCKEYVACMIAIHGQVMAEQKTAMGAAPAAADSEVVKTCLAVVDKQAACGDDFLPALVDLRVKLDLPPGMADKGKTPEGKAALVTAAQEEWKTDSVDPKRTEMCISSVARMPPEAAKGMAEDAAKCLAAADCKAFVACITPFHEKRFTAAKTAPPSPASP
jgi:hypothetical protein